MSQTQGPCQRELLSERRPTEHTAALLMHFLSFLPFLFTQWCVSQPGKVQWNSTAFPLLGPSSLVDLNQKKLPCLKNGHLTSLSCSFS